MRTILKKLNYSDSEYRSAANFKRDLYNYPITADIDGVKVILPFGTRDAITAFKQDKSTIFVSVNTGLDYVGLFIWSPQDNTPEQDYFFDGSYFNEEGTPLYGKINHTPAYLVRTILKNY